MKNPTLKIIWDYSLTIAVAAAIALFIRGFVIEAYQIPSLSMKPTLLSGDTIFVAKWPIWLRSLGIQKDEFPKRGDIIVFSDKEEKAGAKPEFIKRVIGLPGDEIEFKNGSLSLNHENLEQTSPEPNSQSNKIAPKHGKSTCLEEKLSDAKTYQICKGTPYPDEFGPIRVPQDSLFVISDFRTKADPTKKLKTWDIIPINSIKGKAIYIWLSVETHQEFGAQNSQLPQFRFQRMFRRIQ